MANLLFLPKSTTIFGSLTSELTLKFGGKLAASTLISPSIALMAKLVKLYFF